MDKGKTCILCDKDLIEEDTVTVARGLDTIRESSIQRGVKIAKRLDGLSSLMVIPMLQVQRAWNKIAYLGSYSRQRTCLQKICR